MRRGALCQFASFRWPRPGCPSCKSLEISNFTPLCPLALTSRRLKVCTAQANPRDKQRLVETERLKDSGKTLQKSSSEMASAITRPIVGPAGCRGARMPASVMCRRRRRVRAFRPLKCHSLSLARHVVRRKLCWPTPRYNTKRRSGPDRGPGLGVWTRRILSRK
jgi:hypothetical protein